MTNETKMKQKVSYLLLLSWNSLFVPGSFGPLKQDVAFHFTLSAPDRQQAARYDALCVTQCLLSVLCPPAEATMGCVGSKKEQEPLNKGSSGNDESRAQTAHYVKDPTMGNSGSKAVSDTLMILWTLTAIYTIIFIIIVFLQLKNTFISPAMEI